MKPYLLTDGRLVRIGPFRPFILLRLLAIHVALLAAALWYVWTVAAQSISPGSWPNW